MSNLRFTLFVALAVLVQAVLTFQVIVAPPSNPARSPYRAKERYAALNKFADDQSPENKAAFEQELKRVADYVHHRRYVRAALWFAVLLAIDAWVIYIRILSR